jgi:hypothetical protein
MNLDSIGRFSFSLLLCCFCGSALSGQTISADPNPIYVSDGSGLGVTVIFWEAPDIPWAEVWVDNQLFCAGWGSGVCETGKWVDDGTVFELRDAATQAVLATVTVAVLSYQPDPCVVDIDPNPLVIFSFDYYDFTTTPPQYLYSDFGRGSQSGSGKEPFCMIAGVEWGYHEYLNATPSFPSLYKAEMEWEDMGGRIPPFYPFTVGSATAYDGIDLRSGIPFFGGGYTELTIFRN